MCPDVQRIALDYFDEKGQVRDVLRWTPTHHYVCTRVDYQKHCVVWRSTPPESIFESADWVWSAFTGHCTLRFVINTDIMNPFAPSVDHKWLPVLRESRVEAWYVDAASLAHAVGIGVLFERPGSLVFFSENR